MGRWSIAPRAIVGSFRTTENEGQRLAAVAQLRDAVWAARPRDDWVDSDLIVFDVVQGSIVRWVDDAGRSFERMTRALEAAEAESDVGALEEALIQAVSARDKLRTVAVRILAAPDSLDRYKAGVCFNPSERNLRRTLNHLAGSGVASAGRLKSLFEELADHPAVSLRNDIVHALAPFPNFADICWIKTAHLDDRGGINVWDRGPLYPEGSLDQENLLPETLYGWALDSAAAASTLLARTAAVLTEVVEAVGTLSPLPSCYVWPDGRIQLTDPRLPPSR